MRPALSATETVISYSFYGRWFGSLSGTFVLYLWPSNSSCLLKKKKSKMWSRVWICHNIVFYNMIVETLKVSRKNGLVKQQAGLRQGYFEAVKDNNCAEFLVLSEDVYAMWYWMEGRYRNICVCDSHYVKWKYSQNKTWKDIYQPAFKKKKKKSCKSME